MRFHLFEAGAFVTAMLEAGSEPSVRVSTYLKLELLSLDPVGQTEITAHCVSTYLKLELLSLRRLLLLGCR